MFCVVNLPQQFVFAGVLPLIESCSVLNGEFIPASSNGFQFVLKSRRRYVQFVHFCLILAVNDEAYHRGSYNLSLAPPLQEVYLYF